MKRLLITALLAWPSTVVAQSIEWREWKLEASPICKAWGNCSPIERERFLLPLRVPTVVYYPPPEPYWRSRYPRVRRYEPEADMRECSRFRRNR